MRTSAAILLSLLAACAAERPFSAGLGEQDYREATDRIEALEEFKQRQQYCRKRGGTMYMPRTSSSRHPPSTEELELASCSLHRMIVR